MNTHSALVDAVQMTALLAVEIAIVIVAAACLQPIIKSAQWRRTLWQICVLTVTLIPVLEFSGFGREAARLTFDAMRSNIEQPQRRAAVPRNVPTELNSPSAPIAEIPNARPQVTASIREPQMTRSQAAQKGQRSTSSFERAMPWVAVVWLLGTGLLLCRTIVARIMLVFLRRCSRRVEDPDLQSRVQELSDQLAVRGEVEVLECKRLRGPVAFGLFAKVIGLPPGFAADHSERERAVILAHELAHLAGHDSWWYLLAESAIALLWWHPLVWFARRRLQQATESAADEASLLVENGPPLLAQCLVTLGRRLQVPDAPGWLHIGGYSSRLGHRVENLLRLSGPTWRPANRFRMRLAKIVFPVALVLVMALCSGWISPGSLTKESHMKDQTLRRSLPAFALLALLNGDQQLAAADKINQPKPVITATEASANPLLARNATPAQKRKGAEAVRKRLEQIVFNNVQFDSLPLGAVINSLIDETVKRDPDRIGINFLLRNTLDHVPTPPIDPSTGLPIPGAVPEPVDLSSVTIRIMPPLRKVRLIDVLEVIVKMADRPITYSIEEYGVIFSHGSSSRSAQNFETRTFAISPSENFFKGIEVAFGIQAPGKGEGSRLVQQEIFQDLFAQLGIDWVPPKSAFYNELTGIMMVRAAAEDMPVIIAAIQTLGGTQIGDMPPSRSGK